MSNSLPPVGAKLELDIRDYERNIANSIRDASRLDSVLGEIISSSNRTGTALNAIDGNVNIATVVNDSELQSAVSLRDLLDENTSMIAGADDSEIDAAKRKADGLDGTTTLRANVNDADIDTAIRKANDLDGTTTLKANVDDSEIETALDRLQTIGAIDLAFNVAPAAAGFIESVANMTGVPGLIEMNDVLGDLEAKTGRMIPGARELIEELYVNAWGDSREQIAQTIAAAEQLGITGEEQIAVIEQAFGIAGVIGEETERVLLAQRQIVRNELTPSYLEAGDAIITIFQNAGDGAEDLLDTFVEYSGVFNELDLSIEEATAAMVTGVQGGLRNYDTVAMALQEFSIRFNEDTDEFRAALTKIDMLDAAEMFRNGEISGGEFVDGVMTAVSELEDPQKQAQILVELFGTVAEDFGSEAITAIQPITTEVELMAGQAQRAADAMNNDLGTALVGLRRYVEVELGNAINEIFDVDALIDDFKTRVGVFFEELQRGENVFGSIEIAFGLEGFENFVQGIRRGLTDLSIGFLEFIADIKSFLGRSTEGEEANIQRLGSIAFEFDLFEADNAEGIQSAIERAINRGVDRSAIQGAMEDLLNSSLESADIETAENIIEAAEGIRQYHLGVEDASGAVVQLNRSVVDYLDTQLEAGVSTEELASQSEALTEEMLQSAFSFDQADESLANIRLAEAGEDFLSFGDNVSTTRDEVNTSMNSMETTTGATSSQIQSAIGRLYGEDSALNLFSLATIGTRNIAETEMNAVATTIDAVGTRIGASMSAARIEALGLGDELRNMAEIALNALEIIRGITNGNIGQIIGGISSGLGSIGIGGGSSTNINQTNNIVNQNGAQAQGSAQATSAALRGF